MSYKVYLVSYIGAPRDHQGVFVETNSDQSGYIFHVVGTIQKGMVFGHREIQDPEKSVRFASKSYIGTISHSDYDRVQSVVDKILPPGKQFDGPRRIDPTKPIRTCQEWTKDAVQALKDEDILQEVVAEGSEA